MPMPHSAGLEVQTGKECIAGSDTEGGDEVVLSARRGGRLTVHRRPQPLCRQGGPGGVAAVAGVDVEQVQAMAHDSAERHARPPTIHDAEIGCAQLPPAWQPVPSLAVATFWQPVPGGIHIRLSEEEWNTPPHQLTCRRQRGFLLGGEGPLT